MLFNSWQFGLFLPVVFGLYWALPHKYRWILLFIASYYFYMSWNAKYVVLILFTTIISYLAALLLSKYKSKAVRQTILWLTLIACLGVLFIFKYFNFFSESLSFMAVKIGIQLHPVTLRLLLPVGISFYTFQTLSYVIDVYRGQVQPERHFGIYATFISFFPQLVAGPIERTSNLLHQIKAEHVFSYNQATYGLKLMAWGFFKKLCIADNFAVYVDKVYNDIYGFHGFALLLVSFLFTIQIYCDFSGYSDIARGTAHLFGIKLMDNFRSPYFASSIRDFWSRWHISLSTWFRDYVYIPLGGNRVSKVRHNLNLLITFVISGLWHGANWTFIIWGAIHGLAQVVENAFFPQRKTQAQRETQVGKSKLVRIVRVFFVFTFCMLAWIFFRAQTFGEALYVFQNMFVGITKPISYLHSGFTDITLGKKLFASFCLSLLILAVKDFICFDGQRDPIQGISQRRVVVRWIWYVAFIMFYLTTLHTSTTQEFIYFQF